MIKNESSSCLSCLISEPSTAYSIRNPKYLPFIKASHNFFKNIFFPCTVIEWNKLDLNIRSSTSYKLFRTQILEFVRPHLTSTFNVAKFLGLTYLTKLRVGLSHLCKLKFRHNFGDLLNPLCSCRNATESTKHYLLHCSNLWNKTLSL